MFTCNVPMYLWGEAVLTATFLINRLPSRVLSFQTPYNVFLKNYPNTKLISDLPIKVFGCTAFVHINQIHTSKLDPKSLKCVFVGYSPTQKGFKCYSPSTHNFFCSKDVTFLETQPFYTKNKGENDSVCFWDSRFYRDLDNSIFEESVIPSISRYSGQPKIQQEIVFYPIDDSPNRMTRNPTQTQTFQSPQIQTPHSASQSHIQEDQI